MMANSTTHISACDVPGYKDKCYLLEYYHSLSMLHISVMSLAVACVLLSHHTGIGMWPST